MSLDDLQKTTKINKAILQAIETNQQDRLPPAVYVRGFLRAYAHAVGLDPDDLVSRYVEQVEPVVDAAEPGGRREIPLKPATRPYYDLGHEDRSAGQDWWATVALVLAVVIGGYAVARWQQRPPRLPAKTSHSSQPTETAPAAEKAPVDTPPPPSTNPTPTRPEAGTAGSADQPTAAADDGKLHINIRTAGSCWVTATADGKRSVNQMMQQGEQHALDVEREAVLRVGDPAAFQFSINGKAGRSLGRPGEAVTVHITSKNYLDFLRRED